MELSAVELGLQLQKLEVSVPKDKDIEAAFKAATKEGARSPGANGSVLVSQRKQLAALAIGSRRYVSSR